MDQVVADSSQARAVAVEKYFLVVRHAARNWVCVGGGVVRLARVSSIASDGFRCVDRRAASRGFRCDLRAAWLGDLLADRAYHAQVAGTAPQGIGRIAGQPQ